MMQIGTAITVQQYNQPFGQNAMQMGHTNAIDIGIIVKVMVNAATMYTTIDRKEDILVAIKLTIQTPVITIHSITKIYGSNTKLLILYHIPAPSKCLTTFCAAIHVTIM